MLKIFRDQHLNIGQAHFCDLFGSISRLNGHSFTQAYKLVLADQYVCTMQWCQKTGGVRKIGGGGGDGDWALEFGLRLVGGRWWGKLIGGRVCPAQQTPITGITDTSHFTLKPPSFSKWATTSNS